MSAYSVEQIREIYDARTPVILSALGHTYQMGLLLPPNGDPFADTNHMMADRAGLRPGMRVLDAGCGACGPAADIAEYVDGLSIEAVTLSPAQAEAGRAHVAARGLTGRINVTVADYHRLEFPDGTFDAAYFLESACYSHDLMTLLAETKRVLKPGGLLYMKDVFLEDKPLSATESRALAEVNRTYRSAIHPVGDYVRALRESGFTGVRPGGKGVFGNTLFNRRMVRGRLNGAQAPMSPEDPRLTAFGRAHWYPLALRGVTPLYVTDIRAVAPENGERTESLDEEACR